MNEQTPPVKAGEDYEVTINAVGEKGDGIARVKGFVVFVPNVKKGDVVTIRITKVLPKVGFATVVQQGAPRQPKFATITERELHEQDQEPEQHFEDTEDFGEER